MDRCRLAFRIDEWRGGISMSTVYYLLAQHRNSIHSGNHYLTADAKGRFAVDAGSADEVTLIAEGGIPIGANGQIMGDQLGSASGAAASPGSAGEFFSKVVAAGSAVSLSSGVVAQVASLALPAGDFDVSGFVGLVPGTLTSVTVYQGS